MKRVIIIVISVLALLAIGRIFYTILFDNDSKTDIQSIKADVQSGTYDYNKGTDEMNSKNYIEAEKSFLSVLQQKDNVSKEIYINTLINLGLCYAREQKFDLAKKYWKQAADLGDKDAANNLKLLEERTGV